MSRAGELEGLFPKARTSRLVLIGIFLFGILIIYEREKLSNRHYEDGLRLQLLQRLVVLREDIQTVVFSRLLEVRELAALVGQIPKADVELPVHLVERYLAANPEIINVAIAPDLVVTSVYPLAGNESVLGLDYRTNKEQYPKVRQAIDTGQGLVTGPVDLLQGGQGLILRQPIFRDADQAADPGKAWGVLSMVLDYDAFLASLNLDSLLNDYDLLVREAGTEAYGSQTFLGSEEVLERNPETLMIRFPFGKWAISATTRGGWPAARPSAPVEMFGQFVILMLILAAVLVGARLIEARRAAQKHLTNAIKALPDAFVMFDPEGRLVMCNDRYRQMHGDNGDLIQPGASYEEIMRAGLENGVFKEGSKGGARWLEKWRELRNTEGFDALYQHSDGRMIMVSDRIMDDGSTVGLRTDVTQLQRARVAAEAADRAKSDFMAVLSHELRTPLTIMLGMARLLKQVDSLPEARELNQAISAQPKLGKTLLQGARDTLFCRIRQMISRIECSGEHLHSLVDEVLDFAKMEASGLKLEPEALNMQEFLGGIADQIRPLVEEKGLSLEVRVEPQVVEADRKRLKQVLMNFLGNAVKFTSEGGLVMSAERVEDILLIRVCDTGIGIPDIELEKVFDPFHQVDGSNSRGAGGTGLGLAISKEIVELHGGTLTVSSVEGLGSTFTLSLPLSEANHRPADTKDLALAS